MPTLYFSIVNLLMYFIYFDSSAFAVSAAFRFQRTGGWDFIYHLLFFSPICLDHSHKHNIWFTSISHDSFSQHTFIYKYTYLQPKFDYTANNMDSTLHNIKFVFLFFQEISFNSNNFCLFMLLLYGFKIILDYFLQ